MDVTQKQMKIEFKINQTKNNKLRKYFDGDQETKRRRNENQ